MAGGARLDELKALIPMTLPSNMTDRMAARGWITLSGQYGPQRRYRITALGIDALAYGRAERAWRG